MPRAKNTGPGCSANFAGDGLGLSSESESDISSEEEMEQTRSRIGRKAVDSSDSEDEARISRKASNSRRTKSRVAAPFTPTRSSAVPISASTASASDGSSEWDTVEVAYYMCASLRDLAEGKVAPELKLSDNAMAVFDDSPDKRTDTHICGSMSIVDYESTFPVSMHIDVAGTSENTPSKSVTHTGSRGALTIRPKTAYTATDAVGKKIAQGAMALDAKREFLTSYPGWNDSNIEEGITYTPNGETALIVPDHPVISYFNMAYQHLGESLITKDAIDPDLGVYKARADDTKECLESLKQNMQKHLQMQNLYNVKFQLSRARGEIGDDGKIAWDDAEEVLDGLSAARSPDALLDAKHKIYVTVKYEFRALP